MQAIDLSGQRRHVVRPRCPVAKVASDIPQPMHNTMTDRISVRSLHVRQQNYHLPVTTHNAYSKYVRKFIKDAAVAKRRLTESVKVYLHKTQTATSIRSKLTLQWSAAQKIAGKRELWTADLQIIQQDVNVDKSLTLTPTLALFYLLYDLQSAFCRRSEIATYYFSCFSCVMQFQCKSNFQSANMQRAIRTPYSSGRSRTLLKGGYFGNSTRTDGVWAYVRT